MGTIKAWFSGKKAYLTIIAGMLTATAAWSQDALSTTEFVAALYGGFTALFIRMGVAKSGPPTPPTP